MPDAPGAEVVEEEALELGEGRAGERLVPTSAGHGVGARLAGRIGRHAGAYGAAAAAGMVAGLLGVAIFTRYLDQSEFGKMAVLSTISTLITTIATLGIMQGTMRRVYGAIGDDEGGEVDSGDREAIASDTRLALTTGLALTLAFGAVLFLVAFLLRHQVAELFGGPQDSALIMLAAGAGVAGGVMRFARNILRLQLRSGAYLVVTLVYAFGGIPVALPLLEGGLGVEAVLIGFIVANGAAALISLLLMVADLRFAVSAREAWQILRNGALYLPISASFHAVQLGDTLLVAVFGGFSQTGVYRVAQRIATPISFGTSVFQQSWGPLKRDMTHVAVERVDALRTYAAHLLTYYAVFVAGMIVVVAVFADELVRIASGQFNEAAALVPLTALAVAGHGWFVFSYRNARLPRQMLWMIGLSLVAAAVFVGLSILLIPPLGAVGAPLAAIGSWGLATMLMLAANQLIGQPIPFEYRRLATLGGLTLLTWAIADWLLPDDAVGTIAKLLLLLAWAGGVLAAGVVPLSDVRAVARFLRDASGVDSGRRLRARLASLDGVDRALVDQLVRRTLPMHEVAARTGLCEDEAIARAVQVLRLAAGGSEPQATDLELGRLLFVSRPRAERDLGLMAMVQSGADPLDVDLVKRAAAAARSRGLSRYRPTARRSRAR